jgi:protein-arginine kinase activator protein McsA
MDNPNFIRKFCIIGLGNTEELKEDLTVISETSVNFVSGEGLIIATFESAFALPEIEELLNMSNRSYIIFEMTMGFYSANIENKEFQNALFGGDVSSNNTSYNMMLEAIKKVREGLFFTPEQVKDIMEVKETKKGIEELLQEAIDNEDYETAAKLRDKLNSKD